MLAKAYAPLGRPAYASGNNSVLSDPIVQMVAEKLGKTPAQVVLRWGLQMGHTVLPKTKNKARMKENLGLFDWSIPEELFAKFSAIEQASSVYHFSAFVIEAKYTHQRVFICYPKNRKCCSDSLSEINYSMPVGYILILLKQ